MIERGIGEYCYNRWHVQPRLCVSGSNAWSLCPDLHELGEEYYNQEPYELWRHCEHGACIEAVIKLLETIWSA